MDSETENSKEASEPGPTTEREKERGREERRGKREKGREKWEDREIKHMYIRTHSHSLTFRLALYICTFTYERSNQYSKETSVPGPTTERREREEERRRERESEEGIERNRKTGKEIKHVYIRTHSHSLTFRLALYICTFIAYPSTGQSQCTRFYNSVPGSTTERESVCQVLPQKERR